MMDADDFVDDASNAAAADDDDHDDDPDDDDAYVLVLRGREPQLSNHGHGVFTW